METNLLDFMPHALERAKALHSAFTAISVVLVFAGLLGSALRGAYGDVQQVLKGTIGAGIIAVVIVAFPGWIDNLQILSHSVVSELHSDPAKSHERFAEMIAGPASSDGKEPGFWDVIFSDQGGIGKAVLYAIILLMSKLALAVTWVFFVLQQLLVICAIAVSPLFLSMLMLGATKEIGVRFLLSLLGIVAWPLGWAISDMFTTALLELASSTQTYEAAGSDLSLQASQGFFLIIVISIWMLASTIGAPIAISKALQTGSQVGASLFGSLGTAVGQGISYAMGAGASVSMSGGSLGSSTAAASAAGVGGVVAGAAGTTGMILPAAIGTLAVLSSSRPSAEYKEKAVELAKKERGLTA